MIKLFIALGLVSIAASSMGCEDRVVVRRPVAPVVTETVTVPAVQERVVVAAPAVQEKVVVAAPAPVVQEKVVVARPVVQPVVVVKKPVVSETVVVH